jgi:methionyl-tRNA synthetase
MEFSSMMNKYMQDNEVWAKDTEKTRQDVVLCILANGIRLMAGMFEPFMPGFSAKLYFFLGMSDRSAADELLFEVVMGFGEDWERLLGLVPSGRTMNEPIPIFERVDNAASYRDLFGGKNVKTG